MSNGDPEMTAPTSMPDLEQQLERLEAARFGEIDLDA
jgi:hypothetical protein